MILQLNPTLPMMAFVKGEWHKGLAHFVKDKGDEHHNYWVVALDDSGEIWEVKNPLVRMQDNITMDRPAVPLPLCSE